MPLNPQQQKFKECYIDPSSPTFGNALQSALKAGFAQEYAESITSQGTAWFSEIIRDKEIVESAEKALKETIEYNPVDENGKIDVGVGRLRMEGVKLAVNLRPEKWNPKTQVDLTSGGKVIGSLIADIEKEV